MVLKVQRERQGGYSLQWIPVELCWKHRSLRTGQVMDVAKTMEKIGVDM
jgi:hypothetical protein